MRTIKQIMVLLLICFTVDVSYAQKGQSDNKSLYKAFEASVSEGLNLQATAKVGIKPIYGLFSVGTQFLSENYKWAFGGGVGTHLIRTDIHSLNLEYMIFHVNENEIWTDNFNNFQQLRLLYSKRLGEKLSIFGGPSFNLNIAENKESFGHTFESTFAPYDVLSHIGDNHTTKGWIGFTLGVRFDKK